jgi:uronate dehydrogenase
MDSVNSANSIAERRTVLLTGAAGRIGTAFRHERGARYQFRLADKVIETLQDDAQGHEIVALDVADLAACQAACRGVETVLHLAADPDPNADFYGSLLDANIKGTYNIFRAAHDQGCRRVIFASSAQATEAYPLDQQVMPTMPVRPKNMYGVSKCFGEAVASYFAHCEGLSSIAVRIGNYNDFAPGQSHTARNMSAYLSRADMVQLFTQCIDVPDIQFAIVHGISNNRFKRLDLTETRELLNYRPQDDAFRILGLPLYDT